MLPKFLKKVEPLLRPRRASYEVLATLCERFEALIQNLRATSYAPDEKKVLRRFSQREVETLLGLHHSKLTALLKKESIPKEWQGSKEGIGRVTTFSLEQIHQIQEHLKLLPRQRFHIKEAVILTVANFKGGVGKTFQSGCLGQYFALRGYKTLLVDLDPQSSLSATFGVQPETVDDRSTFLPFFYNQEMIDAIAQAKGELPETLSDDVRDLIQPTYWHGLDLIPSNLNMHHSELVLLRRIALDGKFQFYRPVFDALSQVRQDYDIIIIDTPPVMGSTTSAALFAADGVIVPVTPNVIDILSTGAFSKLCSELLTVMRPSDSDPIKEWEIFRVLITRFEHSKGIHQRVANWLRSVFTDYMVAFPMAQSTRAQQLSANMLTIYEGDPRTKGRGALKNTMASANDVNLSIELDVLDVIAQRAAANVAPSPSSNSEAA